MPSELTTLSNTDEKLNENIKTVYFEESPIMSTYLVAIVVGDLIILKKPQLMVCV